MADSSNEACSRCLVSPKYMCPKCKRKGYCTNDHYNQDIIAHRKSKTCINWDDDNKSSHQSLFEAYKEVTVDPEYRKLLSGLFAKTDVLIIHFIGSFLSHERAIEAVKYVICLAYKKDVDKSIPIAKDTTKILSDFLCYTKTHKEYERGIGQTVALRKLASIGSRIKSLDPDAGTAILHAEWTG